MRDNDFWRLKLEQQKAHRTNARPKLAWAGIASWVCVWVAIGLAVLIVLAMGLAILCGITDCLAGIAL